MVQTPLSNKKAAAGLLLILLAGLAAMALSACAPYEARHGALHYHERGKASWYGPGFAGKKTASGERFNPRALTAAHRTLPFGTTLLVTNQENQKSVVVRVNDRGPFEAGRILDLSKAAGARIGLNATGTADVDIVAISPRDHTPSAAAEEGDAESAGEEVAGGASDEKASRTLVASNRLSRGHKGERPVTRNGVEYLITQEKNHEGAVAVEEELPASKAPARKTSLKKPFQRPEPEAVEPDVGDDEELEQIAAAPRVAAKRGTDAEPSAVAQKLPKQAPKAPAAAAEEASKKAPASKTAPSDDEEF